jgi:hypothetical protein
MGFLFSKKKKKEVKLNTNETAILDCKVCRDKIKKYIKTLEKNADLKKEKAKEALKAKNRDRAKINLKMEKMYREQIKSAEGQLEMIETQINQIESLQSQKDALDVLKQGNEALKQLQKEVNVEKFQEIADDLDELKEQNKEITDFFKERGMDEEEGVEDELNRLMASVEKESGGDLPSANKEELTEDKVEEKNKKVAIEA